MERLGGSGRGRGSCAYLFDFSCAEVVCCGADLVDAAGVAVDCHVVAIARSVHIVIHSRLRALVERQVVVRVSWEDGEVVVRCVLYKWIVPAIANEQALEVDVLGSRKLSLLDQLVLGFEVGVEDRSVVSTIALCGEVEVVAGILWESTHEALESLPHARCRGDSGVSSVGLVGLGPGSTASLSVVGASVVRQLHDVAFVRSVRGNWGGIAEAHLRRMVNEQHVRDIAELPLASHPMQSLLSSFTLTSNYTDSNTTSR